MSVFNGYLQGRADQQREGRPPVSWTHTPMMPEERLVRFDNWVRLELKVRLDWTWAGSHKAKRIEQCRLYLERLVLELWRRGWLLDGKRLAGHITGVLDRIGAYQKAGKVQEFWPYFQATVDRYVGANAEEIRSEAMSVGAQIGQLLGPLGVKTTPGRTPLPELLAQRAGEVAQAKEESLREKQARLRRLQASRKAAAEQPQLF